LAIDVGDTSNSHPYEPYDLVLISLGPSPKLVKSLLLMTPGLAPDVLGLMAAGLPFRLAHGTFEELQPLGKRLLNAGAIMKASPCQH
jgi:hypothetical protein